MNKELEKTIVQLDYTVLFLMSTQSRMVCHLSKLTNELNLLTIQTSLLIDNIKSLKNQLP